MSQLNLLLLVGLLPAGLLAKLQPTFPQADRLLDIVTMAIDPFDDTARRAMKKAPIGGLVYSTDSGRMCPACRQPLAGCTCQAQRAAPSPGDGSVRISCETKGRSGKAVTLVRGLALAADDLAALGKRLRTACGAGGAVKDGVLEIQGDHRSRVAELLTQDGWRIQRAGG